MKKDDLDLEYFARLGKKQEKIDRAYAEEQIEADYLEQKVDSLGYHNDIELLVEWFNTKSEDINFEISYEGDKDKYNFHLEQSKLFRAKSIHFSIQPSSKQVDGVFITIMHNFNHGPLNETIKTGIQSRKAINELKNVLMDILLEEHHEF